MSNNFLHSYSHQYEYNSSNDTETNPRKIEYPIFYMVPSSNPNQRPLMRNNILSRIHLLTKFHKDSESNLLKSSIGWHTIYELFFSKYFIFKKDRTTKLVNLKEIQMRIRKEIGKIVEYMKNQDNNNFN